MMKKILMLGGAYAQIPAIQYARSAGCHVLTCDYLPENPGHRYAHQSFNVSTTDREKVLCLAKETAIDGIVAYASDPAAPTAAYVCDALKLPGASYQAVRTLAEKDRFRSFLRENGFYCPDFHCLSSPDAADQLDGLHYPVYVKPVDSSGSKGITRVDDPAGLMQAAAYAFQFSRCKRAIIESLVATPYHQLHGDGFVYNHELVFLGLCDHHFKNAAPIASTFPSRIEPRLQAKVHAAVQAVLLQCGFSCGAINVEARITGDDQVCLMEIGPRSGGNYVPQLMECGTGFDEVAAIVETALGHQPDLARASEVRHCFQYVIGADQPGIFAGLSFSDSFSPKIAALYLHKEIGDAVSTYQSSAQVIGVLIARCQDADDLCQTVNQIRRHVRVVVT